MTSLVPGPLCLRLSKPETQALSLLLPGLHLMCQGSAQPSRTPRTFSGWGAGLTCWMGRGGGSREGRGKGLGAPGFWGAGKKFLGARAEGTSASPSLHTFVFQGGSVEGRPGCSWPQGRTATLAAPFPPLPPSEGRVVRTLEAHGPQSSPGSLLMEERDLRAKPGTDHVPCT